MTSLTYLAAPYRHPDESVMDARMEAVSRVAAALTETGLRVFSPLTYAGALLDRGLDCKADEWWYEYDIGWLALCVELMVLRLPGWKESVGVRLETEAAASLRIPVSCTDAPEQFAGLTPEESASLLRRLQA